MSPPNNSDGISSPGHKVVRRPIRVFEQLEERVLFDAVPDGSLDLVDGLAGDPFATAVEASAELFEINPATAGAEQSPAAERNEIVFVDKSVDGYELLVSDLVITNKADVVFLDADTDGLAQIADALAERSGLNAIHLISHGEQAQLQLGSATLTTESITGEYADQLAAIRSALSDNADVLIYGCNFGEGESGQAAAAALAAATGADVAASDDLTGDQSLGGDWDLEVTTGSIETQVFNTSDWYGLLAATVSRESSDIFNFNDDVTAEPRSQYALYHVTNSGATTLSDVHVEISGLTGDVRLGTNEEPVYAIGDLAPGETGYAWFYLTTDATVGGNTGSSSGGPHNHTIKVYEGDPNSGGVLDSSQAFTITSVEDVISAAANKVTNIQLIRAPVLGGGFVVRIEGDTGTIGSAKIMNFTPDTLDIWPADDFELLNSTITLTGGNTGVFVNDLNFVVGSTSNTHYVADYTFRPDGNAAPIPTYQPMAFISSGNQIKHSSSFPASIPDIPAVANTTTLTKSADVTVLPTGGDVTYTIAISNSSPDVDVTLDDIEDLLPTSPGTATYVSGSSFYNGGAINDPTQSGATLHWRGPLFVAANSTSTLVYKTTLPNVDGMYSNSVVGHIGSVQIDTTVDMTDDVPGTASVFVGTPPVADIFISDGSIVEGGQVVFDVTLSQAVDTVVVDFVASGGTAVGVTDFETTGFEYSTDGGSTWISAAGVNNTEVTFAAGSTAIKLRIDTVTDAFAEPNETFTLAVGTASGSVGDTSDTGTGIILDNDTLTWSVSGPATGVEGDTLDYTVSLTGSLGAGESTSVAIALTDVDTTAADYGDFIAAVAAAAATNPDVSFIAGVLTYTAPADGSTMSSLVISLGLTDDGLSESPEDFTVAISSPTTTAAGTPTLSNTSATTTIADQIPPVLDLDDDNSAGTTGSDYATTFTEGGAVVAITDIDPLVTDGDDTEMASVTITPGGVVNGANEVLTFNGDGGTSISFGMDGLAAATQQITVNGVTLDVAYDGTDFTITRSAGGDIPVTEIQALLAAATYENTTSDAIPGDRTLVLSVNDGSIDSNIAISTITVIPDYLSVSAAKLDTNEDTPISLGITIDPDLYSGGPLEDVIGVQSGYRADTAAATPMSFTIPDNTTSIVITGYSNRPNDTAASDIHNDDYQILSARIDLAGATSSGTLSYVSHLANTASRIADQYSWVAAELGTSILTGSGTIDGTSSAGTDPVFRVVGNTLEVVENHDLQTSYHVEFMSSNRASTNYNGALSDVQQPGDTSSTFTIPAGTNYLVLTENAAAPGTNFQQEYKGFGRIVIDLDTMTASGTVAAERGETAARTVAYSFEGYDISASTPGGILGATSTATVVGDAGGNVDVQHSPNIYINGAGELVVERTAAFATDFTSMYTIEAYDRTGFSSIASIIQTDSDSTLFDATAGTGLVNTLTFDVPASTKVGVFRISMATIGGDNENENMGTGFAVIDLENLTSSGSFMNIRATTPDLVSWSEVPLVDNLGTPTDERVFFTDPGTVSNRTALNQFTDGWGGTAWFDVVNNPDGTRVVTFNAISDVGDNAYQDYQAHGQVTWLGNEPFRLRTGAAGGTFSHGSPVLDNLGVPTGEWDIDIEDIPLLQYIPETHFAGDAFLEIELLSTGELDNIAICVHPIADTPTLTLADAPDTNEGTVADLSGSIAIALVDADGSEVISLIEVSSIPDGFVLFDGTNSFTATAVSDTVDITAWNLSTLTLTPAASFNGTVSLDVRSQTADTVTVGGTPEVDVTETTDVNAGETEATGTLSVTFLSVNSTPALDLDASGAGTDYATTFTEGGGGVGVSDIDPLVTDADDTTMASLTITPGGVIDGANEALTITGDGVTTINIALDGTADPTQQITIGGVVFDVTYDGTGLTFMGNAGEMALADLQALIAATTYENTASVPTAGDRTLTFVVNDGEIDSNIATSTITVTADAAIAQWSLTGDNSVDEDGFANYLLTLDNPLLKAGEQASVDPGISNLDTTSADYASLVTAIQTAITGRPELSFDGTTLTYTSDGTGPMPALAFSLQAIDDSVVEGPEDFRVTISNAASATGENISINTLADQVDTTINDTQGIAGGPDQADWSITGDMSIDEGGTAGYTIGLDQILQAGETATIELVLNDIETTGADYSNFVAAVQDAIAARPDLAFDAVTGVLTFTGTGTLMADLVITLDATDDTVIEGPERFQILLSNSGSTTGAVIGIDASNSDVTTTIGDTAGDGGATEEAVWTFGVDQTVPEGTAGAYLLAVSGSLQNGEVVSVDLALADIDTVAGDYESFDTAMNDAVSAYNGGANSGTVAWDGTTFAFTSDGTGPMAVLPISLGTVNDVVAEGFEDFSIVLSNANSPTGSAISIDATQDDAVTTIDDTIGPGSDDVTWGISGDGSVDEGGSASYTISLAGIAAAGQDSTVELAIGDLDTTGVDYADFAAAVTAAIGGRTDVTFSAGVLTFTSTGVAMPDLVINLNVTDDAVLEGPERYDVALSNAGSTTGISSGIAPLANIALTTINDTSGDGGPAEPGAEWSISGTASVAEGSDAAYTINLNGDLQAGESTSVEMTQADIETAGTDYDSFNSAVTTAVAAYNANVANNGSLTWDGTTLRFTSDGSGVMSGLDVTLGTTGDTTVEGPERYRIDLGNPLSSTGLTPTTSSTAGTVTTTIVDDEDVSWSISGPGSIDEGATGQFTVSLAGTAQAGEEISINVGLTDLDTNSSDYADLVAALTTAAAARTDISFDSGSGTLTYTSTGIPMVDFTFDLGASGDGFSEGPENFRVELSNPASGTGAGVVVDTGAGRVTTTINDQTAVSEWNISGPATADEGTNAVFTVSLSGNFGASETASVEVDLTNIDTNSSDYGDVVAAIQAAADANPDVTFDGISTLTYTSPSDGASMTALAITLPITNDAFIEGGEDFSLDLTNAASSTGAPVGINNASAASTIGDVQTPGGLDDGPGEWNITGSTSVDEGTDAGYTVSLSGTFGIGEIVTVDLNLSDVLTNGSDYADVLAVIQSAADANPNVTFDGVSRLTYTAPSDGAAMGDLTMTLPIFNDAFIEGAESLTLDLSGAGSSTGANVGINNASVSTVVNDTQTPGGASDGPGEWNLSGTTSADEGADAVYTISLSGQFGVNEVVTVELDLNTLDTNSSDYADILAAIQAAADANPNVTFDGVNQLTYTSPGDGATMADLTVTLPITDDAFIEGPESFSLDLTTAASSTSANVGINNDSVSTTINDTQGPSGAADGPGEWSISGSATIDEGQTAQFIVALSGNFGAGEVVTVDLNLDALDTTGSDYANTLTAIQAAADANPNVTFDQITGTLTYNSPSDGAAMTPLTIDLGITDDTLVEGPESFGFTLSNATTTSGANVGIDATRISVVATIDDTQGPGGSIDGPATFSIMGDTSVDEGATSQYTIALSDILQSGEVVTVDLAIGDHSTTGVDYSDFAAAVSAAIVGRPELAFDIGTGTLTYTSTGSAMTDLVINLSATDDSQVEGPESFEISLANATTTTGAPVAIDPAADEVTTIINDTQGPGGGPDTADWSIVGDTSVDEGGTVSFTIDLDALLQSGESATVEFTLSNMETSSADYADFAAAVQAAVSSRPDLTFNSTTGELTFTSTGVLMNSLLVTLNTIDDAFVEGPERFQLLLSNPGSSTGAVIGIDPSDDSVTTTINDTVGVGGATEVAVWSFGADQTVSEGSAGAYTLSLSGNLQAGEVVTVDLTRTNIDTTSADYAGFSAAIQAAVTAYNSVGSNPGSVAFDAAIGTFTFFSDGSGPMANMPIQLGTTDDAFAEGPEDFRIELSNANSTTGAATLIDTTADDAVTTIDDTIGAGTDDVTWSVAGSTSVDEGAVASYTVSLAGTLQAGETTTVDLAVGNLDTTIADYADFAAAVQAAILGRTDLAFDAGTGTLTYTGDGSPMADQVISFDADNDVYAEGPEQYAFTLSNAGSATGVAAGIDPLGNSVTTTINDTQGPGGTGDGPVEWTISGSSNVNEGATAAYDVAVGGNLQSGEQTSVEMTLADMDTGSSDYADFVAAVNTATTNYTGPGSVVFDDATGTLTFTSDGTGPMALLSIDLATMNDPAVEGPERFRIDLSNPQSSTGLAPTVSAGGGSVTTTVNDNESVTWSIAGPSSTDEGSTPQFIVSLDGTPQLGEEISIDLGLSDIDTSSSDYTDFITAMQTATAGRTDLVFDPITGTLTYTSTGAPMVDLAIDLPIADDSLTEGPEQFRIELTNPASGTGSSVLTNPTGNAITTTINDTRGIGGSPDSANWSVTGSAAADEGSTPQYLVMLGGTLQAGEDATVQIGLLDVGTDSSDYAGFVVAVQTAVDNYTGPGALSFNQTTGELTFISDGNSMSGLVIDLPIVDDAILEGPESLNINLSSAGSTTGAPIAVDVANDDVTTTVNDTQGPGGTADGPATWSITAPVSVDEGALASFTIGLTQSLQAGETAGVQIALGAIDTDSTDYADLVAAMNAAVDSRGDMSFDAGTGTLTYTGDGSPMADLIISLPIVDDSFVEGAEDFSLSLSNPTTTTGIAVAVDPAANTATTTINDTQGPGGAADAADWSITGSADIDEGGTATYTIALDATLQTGEVSTIELAFSDVETSGGDYSDFVTAVQNAIIGRPELSFDSVTGTLTYTSDGTPLADIVISLDTTDDTLSEGPERYQISIANSQSPTGSIVNIDPSNTSVSTTINDTVGDGGPNEQPAWSLTGPLVVDEGDTAQFTVSLSHTLQSGETAIIKLSLTDVDTNAGDYADFVTAVQNAILGRSDLAFDPATGLLTYTGDGSPMADIVINLVAADDSFVEGPEDFRVELTNPGSTTGVDVVVDSAADDFITTINDTDSIGGVDDASFSITGNTSVDEGGTATFTVLLGGTLQAGETAIVDLSLNNIDTSSVDYLDFVAAVQTAVAGRTDLAFNPATGTLTYTGDGTPMVDIVIALETIDDAFVEGAERFEIELTNATSTTGAVIGVNPGGNSVTTTINDTHGDGGLPEQALWSMTGSASVDEGGSATYTVALSGMLQSGEISSVTLAVTDIGTGGSDHADFATAIQNAIGARADLSFDSVTGVLTYIGDDSPMTDLVITLDALDDAFVEGPELMNVSLTNPTSSTGVAVAIDAGFDDVNTIINDTVGDGGAAESADWSIGGPADIDEGETGTFTLSLNGILQAGETAYVDVILSDIDTTSSDYADFVTAVQDAIAGRPELSFDSITGTLTYTSDGTSMVPLNIDFASIDDAFTEGPEDINIALSNPGSSTGSVISIDPTGDDATMTVNDTDGVGGAADAANWSISGSSDVAEGGFASYTLSLSGTLQTGETATVQLDVGNIDTTSADYGDFATAMQNAIAGRADVTFDAASGTLTYTGDGQPMQDIPLTLPAIVDQIVEGDEDYSISLTNPGTTTGAPIGVDSGTITTTIESREPANPANPGNTPPVASDDTATTHTDTPVNGQLLSNDGDPNGDVITIDTTPVSNPANGTVTINPDGTFTYTPNSGFIGTDTFEYQITDPMGNIDTAIVTIMVSDDANGPGNDNPTGNDDVGMTSKNTPVSGSVLDNDNDPNGDALLVATINGSPVVPGIATTVSTPGGGTVEINSDGTFVYTPGDDFTETESFTYTIGDGNGGTDTGVVYLSVFDSPPIVIDDINITNAHTPVSGNVLTNDSDPNPGDDLTVNTLPVTLPANGTLTLNADGTYTYAPNPGFVGTDAFEYEVCDENGNCGTATVTIEVRDTTGPSNSAPAANDDAASTLESVAVGGSLISNDGDPDGDVIAINTTAVVNPTGGTLTINADGTFNYTPNPGFIGTDTFVYEIADPVGNTDTATVTITIAADNNGPANNDPGAHDDAGLTQKNTPTSGNVLANDSDPNAGDILTVSSINGTPVNSGTPTTVSTPGGGSIVISSNGDYTYTPGNDFVGTESFSYTISDGVGGSDVATVILSVFDNPPVAEDDIAITNVGNPVVGNVLTNDSDPNPNDDLTVLEVNGQPIGSPITTPNGTIEMNPDGSYTFTPNAGFSGTQTITYTVCDEGGNCDQAVLTVEVRDTVQPPNEPPTALDDSATTFTDSPVSGSLLSNDNDPNGDPLTVNTTPTTPPTSGAVVINPNGTFTYTPNAGFEGTDSFDYEVCDDSGACSTATVTINVVVDPDPGTNDSPIANDDAGTGAPNVPMTGNLLANDSDPNGDPLSINTIPVSAPTNGTLTINPDGSYTYVPNAGFEGTDSFEYEVCDDSGACSTATVTLTVTPDPQPNAPPVVNDESTATFRDTPVSGSLTSNDGDPEGGPVFINTTPVSAPSHGTITINLDGTYLYTPATGFVGTDTVIYEVCDADGACDTAVLTISVVIDTNGPGNDAPIAGDDAGIGTMNDPIVGDLLANDSDLNGDVLTINTTAVSAPANGMLTINPDGTYEYIPNDDFVGNDTFQYEVCDANGACVTASVSLTVFARPPVATPDVVTGPAGTPITGNVLNNDSDPDTGDLLTVNTTPVTPVSDGTLTLNPDGSFTYIPDPGFTGVDWFEYEVCDKSGACGTAVVTVAIAEVSAAKEVISVVPNGENFEVTFRVIVKNTGSTLLHDITVSEDIAARFGPAFVSVGNPVLDAGNMTGGTAPRLNINWSNNTSLNMLDPSFTLRQLNPNESFALTFTVTVDPDAGGTASNISNQVGITAVDNTTGTPQTVTDWSDSGHDPDGNNPTAPGDNSTANDPTPILIGDAGVAKQVVNIARHGNGFNLTIRFTLENTGTATLNQLTLHDDLMTQFGNHFGSIIEDPTIVAGNAATNPALNTAWSLDTAQNIFDGTTGELQAGESITVEVVVFVDAAGTGSTELINQATGGGRPLNPDGSPLLNPDATPAGPVMDLSDSGSDPNGTNPGAPGDTGSSSDSTTSSLLFYTFDSFNEFSNGIGGSRIGSVAPTEHTILSRQITTLAPEPIYSGSARPGTRIIGRIFDSAGHIVAEEMSFADVGGNWMMQMHNVSGLDHHRIEFVEVVGQGEMLTSNGDIYGYLGVDLHTNDYAALEPITSFGERFSIGSVIRNSARESLMSAHRANNHPNGFGR